MLKESFDGNIDFKFFIYCMILGQLALKTVMKSHENKKRSCKRQHDIRSQQLLPYALRETKAGSNWKLIPRPSDWVLVPERERKAYLRARAH